MSESMQTKPGELVPSSNLEPKSEMDQMFAGLGLGSYVSKKDTGAIATGLMSNDKSQVMNYNKRSSPFKMNVLSPGNKRCLSIIYRQIICFSPKEAQ